MCGCQSSTPKIVNIFNRSFAIFNNFWEVFFEILGIVLLKKVLAKYIHCHIAKEIL